MEGPTSLHASHEGNTEVAALCILFTELFSHVHLQTQTEALWGEQAAIHFIFGNIYSTLTATGPSHHTLDSTTWECPC